MEAMKTTTKYYLMLDGECSTTSIEEIEGISNDDGIEIVGVTDVPQYLPSTGWFRIITTYARTRKTLQHPTIDVQCNERN